MRFLLLFLLALGVLLLAGIVCQQIAACLDRHRMTKRGRFVEFQGCAFFCCEHGSGTPTVIFESGLVASSLNWWEVQRALSATMRTFSYDRLGLGWSDRCVRERTLGALSDELRGVLDAAGVAPPYLLVAHSYGALIARRFAAQHAADLAGIVLLDPMRTEGWLASNVKGQKILKGGRHLMLRAIVPTWLGLTRVGLRSLLRPTPFTSTLLLHLLGKSGGRSAGRMTRELSKMPVEVQHEVVAQWSVPAFYAGSAAYIRTVPAVVHEVQQLPPISAIPTLVLRPADGPETSEAHAHCSGPEVSERLLEECGHWVHLDQPGMVVEAVRAMLAGRQAGTPAL